LEIGSWSGSTEFFKGTIDEPAVYPAALSAAQVSTHRQVGLGEAGPDHTVKAPTNLTATVVSDSQINLTWTDNSSNEGEFLIERDTSPSFPSPAIGSVWSNSTFFSEVGLAPSTTYYFRVKARNASDSSTYSNTVSATTLSSAPPPSGYSAAVIADSPISYWRLGEASGTSAADERGVNAGAYANSPSLGQASLLANDSANKAVGFDGANDNVRIPSSATLGLGSPLSLEAWIKPAALPSAGGFASVLTKAESYSLQFNGPRLEFTIMQNGARRRLQAPVGAIATGQAYHVVGTYDGATQRLYVNGAQVASAALSGPASASTSPLYIGSWNGSTEFFKGTIDEVAVYGATLSAARVSAHQQAAASSGQSISLRGGGAGSPLFVAAGEDRAYSISSPPTFVDYCRLRTSA
jgi:Concanavalin A-like lectin/glucanases superfamily/Fibronectin type III domain